MLGLRLRDWFTRLRVNRLTRLRDRWFGCQGTTPVPVVYPPIYLASPRMSFRDIVLPFVVPVTLFVCLSVRSVE